VPLALAAICACARADTGTGGAAGGGSSAGADKISRDRTALIETAKAYLGTPYRAGGDTAKGFDCSGFVWFVYHNAIGMDVPRSSRGMWESGAKSVSLKDALPGDVLVFSSRPGGKGAINHSALFVNEASMIHAVSDGPKTGVLISPMNDSYFAPRLIGVKRFLKD
jgi:cell wall-associated NlpC family hydrolase